MTRNTRFLVVVPTIARPFPVAQFYRILLKGKGALVAMPAISLKAHFDGTSIQLDEPYDLPRDAKLLVTVLRPAPGDSPLPGWAELGAKALARAYGDDEPDYSAADVQP